MPRLPIDVLAHLETQRQHMLTSVELVKKSIKLHAEVQAQIEASVALLERAKGLKWLTNAPTLPRWIAALPGRKGTS